jgi:serine/threonine protein phosphatase PrpC
VRTYAKNSLASPAVALRDHAYSAGSTDNLSVIIVYLTKPKSSQKATSSKKKGLKDSSKKKKKSKEAL